MRFPDFTDIAINKLTIKPASDKFSPHRVRGEIGSRWSKPQLRAAANGVLFRQVTMRSVSRINWADQGGMVRSPIIGLEPQAIWNSDVSISIVRGSTTAKDGSPNFSQNRYGSIRAQRLRYHRPVGHHQKIAVRVLSKKVVNSR